MRDPCRPTPGQNPWPMVLIAVATTIISFVLDRVFNRNKAEKP